MDKSNYIMSSLDNALNLIDLLSEHNEIGVAEISKLTGINKASVFKMLYTLENKGFVNKTVDAKYKLGIKFFDYGSIVLDRQDIVEVARPFIQKLRDKHNETTHLGILDEDLNVFFILKEDSKASIVMASRIGRKMPFYATSVGKAIIAYSLNERIIEKMKNYNYVKFTENTYAEYEDLIEHLNQIRNQGYSEDLEEYEIGLTCFAVPVFDIRNKITAAISISGPTERIKNQKEDLIESLKDTTLQLSRCLGYK